MEITSSEFFINLKSLPPESSREFKDLIKWEEEKIKGGVTINGVYISGWLYWHLNHWWIITDYTDQYGNEIRKEMNPILRDNEWVRAEALEQCKIHKVGYVEVGARQSAKSETEASYFGMNAIMYKNTQNVIVCGNDGDLGLMKAKVDFGLKKIWKGLSIPRLDKTWRSNQIRLGYKRTDGEDEIWSYIIIRNAKDGHNTEVAAGTTAKSFIIDEIGKFPFGATYEAAKPALIGKTGMRAVPILMGTGGAFEKGKDAERIFYNPEPNGFLGHKNSEGKTTGLFLSGEYQYQYKYPTTLADYLRKERGLDIEKGSDLENITIEVSDKELARKSILAEREEKRKGHDQVAYLKTIMYAPLTPEECFMSVGDSIFNVRAAKDQKARLLTKGARAESVILYHDGKTIRHEKTDKLPITTFPTDVLEDLNAPIQVYEFPIPDAPYGLYSIGIDPYRIGKSAYSDSLGAVYVFKRMHDITSELYQDMVVASYVARPDKIEDWQEQARLLIKWYNGRALCENDEMSFINYMIAKGDGHYLEDQPQWLKEIVPNTKADKIKGIHRSAEKIRMFLHGLLKTYTEEVVYTEKDEQGSTIKEHIGMTKILDPMLLEEISQYNDLEGNYDRVIAFELALAQARKMDPILGKIKTTGNPRNTAILNSKTDSLFTKRTGKLFRKRNLFIR